ncbi:hypothetical protein F8388_024757 [Cannabis sativa]|uniref:Uncharacterized protein n=1 Tax=Cannabis sativa TaxID=3483 RepID=A0A7J6GC12_CANSA|nr:hypothetical protein F8388_024757 [Cannabis sativa]
MEIDGAAHDHGLLSPLPVDFDQGEEMVDPSGGVVEIIVWMSRSIVKNKFVAVIKRACGCSCFGAKNMGTKAEIRCVELELEVKQKINEYEALEAKFRALEAEKVATQEKLEALKREFDVMKEHNCCGKGETKEVCGRAKRIEKIVDLTNDDWEEEEEDKMALLMIENRVLECEKKKAERDVKAWEKKFEELQAWILHSQKPLLSGGPMVEKTTGSKNEATDLAVVSSLCRRSPGIGIDHPKTAGSAFFHTPCKSDAFIKEEAKGVSFETGMEFTASQLVKRQLVLEQESPSKNMAPSTPGGARLSALNTVDILDSDEEPDNISVKVSADNQGSGNGEAVSPLVGSVACAMEMTGETKCRQNNMEDLAACKQKSMDVCTPKRKRALNVVMSDSDEESNSDDNKPIARLKRINHQRIRPDQRGSFENATTSAVNNDKGAVTPRRRRLVPLKECRGRDVARKESPKNTTKTNRLQGVPTNADTETDESDGVSSDSEGESLGGFIVKDSDASGGHESSSESGDHESSSESVDLSDDKIDFSEILSNLQRKKDKSFKWEFEADMLADFGKDTELCMKAVCALYRQQTADEKICKGTLVYNNRGFSKFDALRGTNLAVYLTDGDEEGHLTKTVEELEKYDPKAVKLCRTLATNYSKQLFEIYKNKEDPLFLP